MQNYNLVIVGRRGGYEDVLSLLDTLEVKEVGYEKKYKQALGWMQGLYNGLHGKTKEEAETYFPELVESEDERIRKRIIHALHGDVLDMEETTKALIWLEKQGSIREIVERCKTSWYNEGKIQGQIEGLSDDEKYLQGWHDALEKQGERKPFDYENATIIQKDFAPKKGDEE